jgi:hypothetical protein
MYVPIKIISRPLCFQVVCGETYSEYVFVFLAFRYGRYEDRSVSGVVSQSEAEMDTMPSQISVLASP